MAVVFGSYSIETAICFFVRDNDKKENGHSCWVVFCCVPDPVLCLGEGRRVLKPGGRVLLLEHVRSNKLLVGTLVDVVNPIVVRMMGPHINWRTVRNVEKGGFALEKVEDIGGGDIFKMIIARKDGEWDQISRLDVEYT